MAWINDKWVNYEEREEIIKGTKNLVTAMSKNYSSLNIQELEELEGYINDLERLERIHRSETDVAYFFYEYFSEARNPGNSENLVPNKEDNLDNMPDFHNKLANILNTVSSKNRTARIAWGASRGSAKSALLTNNFSVHQLVFRLRKMILILSETLEGSKKFIKWAANQLKYNRKLRDDFGILLTENKVQNEMDTAEAFITSAGSKIEGTSVGRQVRGFRNGSVRPDLFLIDDAESRSSTNTAELREASKNWFNQDLMPAYDPLNTAVIFMGTLVREGSLLDYVLKERNDFIRNKFPAIIKEPIRMDLWEEFTRIYCEYKPTKEEIQQAENGEMVGTPQKNAALRFFEDNREEMTRGSEVLWERRFPIQELMIEKINLETKAWNTEYMMITRTEEDQDFDSSRFINYTLDEILDGNGNIPNRFSLHGFWDVAGGRSKRTDENSIVTVLKDNILDKFYVYDTWAEKCDMNVALDKAVELIRKFRHNQFTVETIGLSYDMYNQLQEKLRQQGIHGTRIKAKNHHKDYKNDRILALQPHLYNGDIKFLDHQTRIKEQFDNFERDKKNNKDDIIDALSSVISESGGFKKMNRTYRNKPKGF